MSSRRRRRGRLRSLGPERISGWNRFLSRQCVRREGEYTVRRGNGVRASTWKSITSTLNG
jgi:hypothetical protein